MDATLFNLARRYLIETFTELANIHTRSFLPWCSTDFSKVCDVYLFHHARILTRRNKIYSQFIRLLPYRLAKLEHSNYGNRTHILLKEEFAVYVFMVARVGLAPTMFLCYAFTARCPRY